MRLVGRQLLCCLLLASLAAAQTPDEEMSQFETQMDMLDNSMCALKLLSLMDLVTIQTSSLAVDKVTLRQGSHLQIYVVSVPLREPAGKIASVIWETRDLSDAVTFVRLLQHGKMSAVKVEPRQAVLQGEGLTDDQQASCRNVTKDSEVFKMLFGRLQECTTCRIKGLVFSAKKLKE